MSFPVKTDRFGLADGTRLFVKSLNPNRTNSTVEATNEDDDVVACEVLTPRESPSVEYRLKKDLTDTYAKDIVLGGVTTVTVGQTTKYYCLTSVSLGTSAGGEPTVAATGEEVPDATPNGTYTLEDALNILAKAKAQILAGAFSVSGTKCHVGSCSAVFSVKFVPTEVGGELISWDCTGGRIVVTAQVTQAGSDAPTLTAAEGWTTTAVPADNYPDAQYTTWNVTFTKFLTRDSEEAE